MKVRQFLLFALAGGVSSVVNLVVFAVLYFVGLHYLVAGSISYALAMVTGFFLSQKLAFSNQWLSPKRFIQWISVYLLSLLANLGLLEVLVTIGSHPILAQGLAILALLPINFLAVKFWVFHER